MIELVEEKCVPVDSWNTLFIVTGDVTDGTTISQRTLTASLLLYVLWWGCCSGGRQGRGGRVLVLVSDELTHRTSRLSDRGRYNGREMTSPDKKTRQGCRGEIEMAPTLWNPNDWTGLQYFYFITFYSYFRKIYFITLLYSPSKGSWETLTTE